MAISTTAWLPWFLLCFLTQDAPFDLLRAVKSSGPLYFAIPACLSVLWGSQVTNIVPQPYLDEVFHIPQAQAYCERRYDVWDPKLTTPPGLYVLATLFAKLKVGGECDVYILRLFNSLVLILVVLYACDCRSLITLTWTRDPPAAIAAWKRGGKMLTTDALHTATNIALFPLMFFFSGMFYTDVLSTCIVLRMYRIYLERRGAYTNSAQGSLWLYPAGILALTIRQTNIFWATIFMGGLEAVRVIKANQAAPDTTEAAHTQSWQGRVSYELHKYSRGDLHDLSLEYAGLHDFVLCAISIVVAATFQPLRLLGRLWPYLGLLVSFAGFVSWNGGVVLGDKSNHVATIHIPQMLYIWPFIVFFSAPIIIPVAISFAHRLRKLISLPLFPRLVWNYLLVSTYTGLALSVTLLTIKFNTIIHPFTLADNRHYMFYVFRYTILRQPLIRYFLAPIYLGLGYLVYITLSGPGPEPISPILQRKGPPSKSKKQAQRTSTQIQAQAQEGPTISFVLILLITTTLSLVTAPLVEPRYFILPWVMWRLNVPLLPSKNAPQNETAEVNSDRYQNHEYRLWLESLWFFTINAVTAYVFLYRGFEWKQEPGTIQRFMW